MRKLIVVLVFSAIASANAFAFETITVDRVYNDKPFKLRSELYLPEKAQGKIPAMIIMHGSAGVQQEHKRLAHEFQKMGVAGVIVESFASRRLSSTVEHQDLLNAYPMMIDVAKVITKLSQRTDVDPNRIGIIGFSKGATVALKLGLKRWADILEKKDHVALVIAAYPWCGGFPVSFQTIKAPIHILIGEKDTYNGVENCQKAVENIRKDGGNADIKIYPGAKHGFNMPGPTSYYNKRGQNFSKCRFDEVGTNIWIEHESHMQVFPVSNHKAIPCITKGVSGGYNEEAAKEFNADVRHFVRETFKLENK